MASFLPLVTQANSVSEEQKEERDGIKRGEKERDEGREREKGIAKDRERGEDELRREWKGRGWKDREVEK